MREARWLDATVELLLVREPGRLRRCRAVLHAPVSRNSALLGSLAGRPAARAFGCADTSSQLVNALVARRRQRPRSRSSRSTATAMPSETPSAGHASRKRAVRSSIGWWRRFLPLRVGPTRHGARGARRCTPPAVWLPRTLSAACGRCSARRRSRPPLLLFERRARPTSTRRALAPVARGARRTQRQKKKK